MAKTSSECSRSLLRWACRLVLVFGALAVLAFVAAWHFLGRVPKAYPAARHPIDPAWFSAPRATYPAGFDSPYLGHTGSADGKGGAIFGGSKTKDLECEARMGLRWTFVPVNWRALEPEGPADLERDVPPPWRELDAFVIEARRLGLNILMQAPVVGGNAGGPPRWAGRREKGKSAPARMDAAAEFARKLAARYAPGGALAKGLGWTDSFGVRAWEMDNEPDSYLTHWGGQAADYAEFVTKVSRAIKSVDTNALVLAPATSVSRSSIDWIKTALGSGQGRSMSAGIDVVSFHIYEGLDSALRGEDRDVEMALDDIQAVFDQADAPKREYWHTEGNFDFLGILSAPRRAAWRIQFMTRAFAAGVAKVCVMDASPIEQLAVRAYIEALPKPFPMYRMTNQATVLFGRAEVFWHPDRSEPESAGVWVLWSDAGSGGASVSIPVKHPKAVICQLGGTKTPAQSTNGMVPLFLLGDDKMAPPVLLIDR